jgi:hypothetical protein
VNESRLIAEQQRKLISEGRAVPNAIQLLKEFEEALEKLERPICAASLKSATRSKAASVGGLFHPPSRRSGLGHRL